MQPNQGKYAVFRSLMFWLTMFKKQHISLDLLPRIQTSSCSFSQWKQGKSMIFEHLINWIKILIHFVFKTISNTQMWFPRTERYSDHDPFWTNLQKVMFFNRLEPILSIFKEPPWAYWKAYKIIYPLHTHLPPIILSLWGHCSKSNIFPLTWFHGLKSTDVHSCNEIKVNMLFFDHWCFDSWCSKSNTFPLIWFHELKSRGVDWCNQTKVNMLFFDHWCFDPWCSKSNTFTLTLFHGSKPPNDHSCNQIKVKSWYLNISQTELNF